MDVVAEVHAQDAESEQQREGGSVGCDRLDGGGAGGGNSAVGRAFEGDDGGVTGCEGVYGVEEMASMTAREAEGSDEDEVMAGKENAPMQRAEDGGGSIGGIKKRGHRGGTKEFKAERRKPNKYGDKVTRTTEGLTALARSD